MRKPASSILIMALVACGLARAQTPQGFAAQVDKGVRATRSLAVEQNKSGGWVRHTVTIEDVVYDVKRTDSALNPLVGVVSASATTYSTDAFETKAEAQAVSGLGKAQSNWKIDLVYHPNKSAKRWSFASGSYELTVVAMGGLSLGTTPVLKSDLGGTGMASELAAAIGR